MWLNRLPPVYRRRYYTNLAIVVAIVIFVANVGRLGQHNGTIAILTVMDLGFAFLCIWPAVSLLRARPRPGNIAFVLAGAYLGAFAYAFARFFLPVPGSSLAFLAGYALLCSVLVCYRGIVFSSLFDRDGRMSGFRKRLMILREARRASKGDTEALVASIRRER